MKAHRVRFFAATVAALAFAACSPLNQAAVTQDVASRQPAVRVSLCGDETVVAVSLFSEPAGDVQDESGKRIWRIEASAPSKVEYFVVGQTAEGFVEATPLPPRLPETEFHLSVETTGGYGGVHGASFALGELREGVYLHGGEVITIPELDRVARENCSFLGLALSGWVGWALGAIGAVGVAALVAVAIRRTRNEPQLPMSS